MDYATDTVVRGRYARVCIELELSKALVTRVWVAKAWQTMEYENLDLVCFTCGLIGHRKDQCLMQKEKNKGTLSMEQSTQMVDDDGGSKVRKEDMEVVDVESMEVEKDREEAN